MSLFNCTHSKQAKQQQQGKILEKIIKCQIASDQNLRLSCQVYKMYVWIKVSTYIPTYILVSFQMVLRHIILNPFSFSSFVFETYQFLFDS